MPPPMADRIAAPPLPRSPHRALLAALPMAFLAGCVAGASPVYPSRPPATPGEAMVDPSPSPVTVHLTVTGVGLRGAVEDAIPKDGEGTYPMLGTSRRFTWKRDPIAVKFAQGRLVFDLHVLANAEMPIGSIDLPLDLHIAAEPVVTSEYVAKLQSVDVSVGSRARIVKIADSAAGVLEKIKAQVEERLAGVAYPLRPLIAEAYDRIARPVDLPLGDAHGCANLRVLGVQAGPTVLADGIEKDLAIIVAPSVTLPCPAAEEPVPLPPLANVATLPSGPFTVSIPVAARYEELARAMSLTFTDGKLFFSQDFPALYLEKPEIYAAKDELVLKLHIAGPIHKFGIDTDLDGDLYMTGHPAVVDNELRVPDLEQTIETASFLLKLKAVVDADHIRDQARAALRLDIGERLRAVRSKLSTDLSFAGDKGCFKAEVIKIEVTGVHVHAAYLRVYVAVTGAASAYLPCPDGGDR
jgi:hypothetical protein